MPTIANHERAPAPTLETTVIRDPKRFEQLIASTREFVRDVAIPNESRVERDDEIPPEIVATMRSLGLFGWSIPEAYGGAGLTTEELALANMEISQMLCCVSCARRNQHGRRV